VVMVNAELDSLLGPILKAKADRAGVVYTHTDGEEPGVAMTLLRYLRSLGLRPVAAGNLKGMVDYYRTPETQRGFAEKYNQDVRKVTSFADATKLSMETTVLANATGFHAGRRGMYGPACAHVQEMSHLLPADQMLDTGLVDYALGAAPHTGAFVIVYEESPLKKAQLTYYKLGDGPFYVFYTPYHLPCIQIASTIGGAAIHHDATVAPIEGPVCEVVAIAKRDLKAGQRLDGIGGFCTYGLIDNTATARGMTALPISLSEDCVLRRDVAKDEVLSFDDVNQPTRVVVDGLWREQMARWPQPRRAAKQ
jgi:predicted homoserine dehydrogenase-like protein